MSEFAEVIGIGDFLGDLNRFGDDLAPALEKALDVGAVALKQAKVREATITETRPIPSSKTGRPKWKRTGALVDDITIESSPGQRLIVNRGPSEAYEERLADLPDGEDGINRTNKMADNAVAKTFDQLPALIETTLASELKL